MDLPLVSYRIVPYLVDLPSPFISFFLFCMLKCPRFYMSTTQPRLKNSRRGSSPESCSFGRPAPQCAPLRSVLLCSRRSILFLCLILSLICPNLVFKFPTPSHLISINTPHSNQPRSALPSTARFPPPKSCISIRTSPTSLKSRSTL